MNTESDTPADKETESPPGSALDQPADDRSAATIAQECPTCQRSLPADSPQELCPYCLLAAETGEPEALWSRQSVVSTGPFVPPEPHELQPFFPALQIDSLIGRGGMGAVYRARQTSLGRDVALKILPPEVAATEGFTDRFLREARALARLGHPNLVAIFEHGTTGPYAFLVMELIEGINLRELMAGDRLPPAEAFRIVPQLCDALQYAHSKGVVHRDIKPENILVDESGHVTITDFGLAKLVTSDDDPAHSRTRHVMGTIHYMAPEQIERPREVDHRADLYSLGVVFYELLTGELPLGRFSPPSEKAGTTRQVDRVVLKSLEKEPDRRYASADEVRSDLDRPQSFAVGERAQAMAQTVDEKARSLARQWGPKSNLTAAVLTIGFYLFALVSLFGIFGSHDPLFTASILIVVLWVFAVLLRWLYSFTALPAALTGLGAPIEWFAYLPKRIYRETSNAAKSIEGLRWPWMIAAMIAFGITIACVTFAFTTDEDFFAGAIAASLVAWLLMRLALPGDVTLDSFGGKLLTYPIVGLPLVPVTLLILSWPMLAWFAISGAFDPPGWFQEVAGVTESLEDASKGSDLREMKAHVFGCLSFEFAWLSLLATINAISPSLTRWWARPLMDDWQGQGRLPALMLCFIAFAFSVLIWSA